MDGTCNSEGRFVLPVVLYLSILVDYLVVYSGIIVFFLNKSICCEASRQF